MIPNRFKILHDTHTHHCPKHLLLKFLVGHVLVGVNTCGRVAITTPLPQIASLPKQITN